MGRRVGAALGVVGRLQLGDQIQAAEGGRVLVAGDDRDRELAGPAREEGAGAGLRVRVGGRARGKVAERAVAGRGGERAGRAPNLPGPGNWPELIRSTVEFSLPTRALIWTES